MPKTETFALCKRKVCREAARRVGLDDHNKAEKFLNECIDIIVDALLEGEHVKVYPFGTLFVKYDKRPRVRKRLLKLKSSKAFNSKLQGVPTEFPEWYKKLGG